jgi:hypothetical protein
MPTEPAHRRTSRRAERRPLPDVPVTVADADALGWTRPARRHAVASGDLITLGRGVVGVPLDADLPARQAQELALLTAARASAARCVRAVLSHFAAGIEWGMPTFGPLDLPCLTVPAGTPLRRLSRAHLHRATLPEDVIAQLGSDALTRPARTVLDIAREHGVPAGVVAADHALRTGLCTRADLAAAYEMCARWPGRRAARATLLSADEAAESPLESLSRLRLAAAGLPAPQSQVELCDLDGRYITRSDFYWDEFGVVGEADGQTKYAKNEGQAVLKERATATLLEETGLIVVRWGWPDLFAFNGVIRRLAMAFQRGARPGSPQRRWGVVVRRPRLHP